MRGGGYRQAARSLHLETSTIRSHLHNIYKRMGVASLTEAISMMHREGWVDEPLLPSFKAPREDCVNSVENWTPTPGQRVYLDALDRLLRERSDDAREHMAGAFVAMCGEAQTTDPRKRSRHRRTVRGLLGWLQH